MRHVLAFMILACWSFGLLQAADAPLDPKNFPAPIRVACVGDSITEGSGVAKGKSYPAQLGALLGAGWDVRNFGKSGRTLLRKGDFPYWNEAVFTKAQAFKPNVVIIKLGTNDTKPQNWKVSADFAKDYNDLIGVFAALDSHPRIYVCRPCPVFEPGKYNILAVNIPKVIEIVDQLAAQHHLGIIDFHAALADKPKLLPDTVHPNAEGYAVMAETAYRVLTGKEPAAPAK